jgi:APA family basic amino acid/polyamine antiporter
MQGQGKISFQAAVLMSLNIIIGSFIFVAPQRMAVMAGNFSFLGWTLAGLLLLPIVLTIAQAARVFPGAGGFYHYCTMGINESAGFLALWAYLLGYLGSAATVVVIVRERLVSQTGLVMFDQHPYLFYAGFIFFISLLNMLSVELISRIQSGVTLLKLMPLFMVIVLLVFYLNPSISYHASDLFNLGYTLPLAFFGYWGFESCTSIGHLIQGGAARVPRVIISAFLVAVVLNTLFHFGVTNIMGTENLIVQGAGSFPNFLGFSSLVTHVLLVFIVSAILLSLISTTYGLSLTNIANITTLAERGSIFGASSLAKKLRNGSPYNAVVLNGIVMFALIYFLPSVQVLSSISNFGVASAFLSVLVAMLRHNLQHKNIGKLLITALGFFSFAILLYFSWEQAGQDAMSRLISLTPILVGLPAGLLMYKWLKWS